MNEVDIATAEMVATAYSSTVGFGPADRGRKLSVQVGGRGFQAFAIVDVDPDGGFVTLREPTRRDRSRWRRRSAWRRVCRLANLARRPWSWWLDRREERAAAVIGPSDAGCISPGPVARPRSRP